VGLERGPLSLVSATKELLERKSSCSGLEIREYGRKDPSRSPRGALSPQKLALTSPTSGGRPVSIFLSCTHKAEWTQFQTHHFSENLVASGIQLGPLDL
jgi:hypothetical protein